MMKKTIDLVRLQLQVYFKGSSFVMPFVVAAVFLYIMYSVKPLAVVSSFLISCAFLFLLMVWIGLSVSSGENTVTEQLILLRVQSPVSYYAGKITFLLCIALLLVVFSTGFPVVQNVINGYELFDRPLLASDVGNAFLLQLGSAFSGAGLGGLMHPRVVKDRKMAIILAVFMAVLSVTQTTLVSHLAALKAIFWVLPPIMLPAQVYGNADFFSLGQTLMISLVLFFYGMVYCILKSVICERNKF